MRIISKFHDYYDSIQGYGFDPTITFVRKTQEIHKHKLSKDIPDTGLYVYYSDPYGDNFKPDVECYGDIYFCGKRYRFIQTKRKEKFITYYSFESINKYILKYNKKRHIQSYINGFRFSGSQQKALKNYFIFNDNFESNVKLHEEFDSPIFVVYNTRNEPNLVINPSLKDMQFQKVFNPYSTFQEIDMFLSGVMQSPDKNMINISDKDMRDKKGFNNKSFKKDKWKHIK